MIMSIRAANGNGDETNRNGCSEKSLQYLARFGILDNSISGVVKEFVQNCLQEM